MPDNKWALNFLAGVHEDFHGEVIVEFKAGRAKTVRTIQSYIPPEQEAAYRKSLEGVTPLKPDSPESP